MGAFRMFTSPPCTQYTHLHCTVHSRSTYKNGVYTKQYKIGDRIYYVVLANSIEQKTGGCIEYNADMDVIE